MICALVEFRLSVLNRAGPCWTSCRLSSTLWQHKDIVHGLLGYSLSKRRRTTQEARLALASNGGARPRMIIFLRGSHASDISDWKKPGSRELDRNKALENADRYGMEVHDMDSETGISSCS